MLLDNWHAARLSSNIIQVDIEVLQVLPCRLFARRHHEAIGDFAALQVVNLIEALSRGIVSLGYWNRKGVRSL